MPVAGLSRRCRSGYSPFSIGVSFLSYSSARALRSLAPSILLKNSSITIEPSTVAQPGAAGVSFEFEADSIRAAANWSSPSEST